MYAKLALLSALVLSGCAGLDAQGTDPLAGAQHEAAFFGNAAFTEQADVEHPFEIRADEPTPSLTFDIVGRETHRVILNVRDSTRVRLQLDAPRTATGRYPLHQVSFHGEGWRDTPPVEMRIARELASGNDVDVVLAPGSYAFDLGSYRTDEDEVHRIELAAESTEAEPAPTFDGAPARSVGGWIAGELHFGQSAIYQLAGSEMLGLAASSIAMRSACSRTWIERDGELNLQSTSSSTWRSLTAVDHDEALYVELIGCQPGTTAYDHLVIDEHDYQAL